MHGHPSGLPMMRANQVVMEIKVNKRIPDWISGLIAAQNLQMDRVSKYCSSIELAKKMPLFHYRNHTAESSREILSSSFSVFSSLEEKIRIRKQH
jgi:hypothetical protein